MFNAFHGKDDFLMWKGCNEFSVHLVTAMKASYVPLRATGVGLMEKSP